MCPSWHIHTSTLTFLWEAQAASNSTSPKLGPGLMRSLGRTRWNLQKRQLMSKEKGSGGNCCSPQGQNHLILQCCGYFRNHVLMVHFPYHLPALNACKIVGRVWLPFAFNAIGFSHKSAEWKQSFWHPSVSLSTEPCLNLCMCEVMCCRILLNFVTDSLCMEKP